MQAFCRHLNAGHTVGGHGSITTTLLGGHGGHGSATGGHGGHGSSSYMTAVFTTTLSAATHALTSSHGSASGHGSSSGHALAGTHGSHGSGGHGSGGGHGGGHVEHKDLLYLFLFWVCCYVSAILSYFTRLSPLLYYLLFGALLRNLSIIEHTPFLDMLAEIAITLLFFALGFEETVGHFLGGIKKAWGIALIGAIVPFLCGFGCAALFWPEAGIKPALMCGLAVTATAVSLTMIALKTEGLALSKPAIGIMTSAVLDDVGSLACVAIMVPIATGEADPTVLGIGWILAKSAIFFGIIVILNVVVFPHDVSMPILKEVPFLRSIGVHQFLRFQGGEQAVIVSLIVALGTGLLAKEFGFHPAIGAYMAGLVMEERYFDLVPESIPEGGDSTSEYSKPQNVFHHVKDIVENVAFCWLGPIFFLHLGSQIEFKFDVMSKVILQTLVIFISLFIGQIASAGLAARYVPGGFNNLESLMIGFGMLGRAELFFVVLNICYIENKIFNEEMFFALTFAAMLLNISVPITISLYKPFFTGEKPCPLSCFKQEEEDEEEDEIDPANVDPVHKKAVKSLRQHKRRVYRVDSEAAVRESLLVKGKDKEDKPYIKENGQGGTEHEMTNKAEEEAPVKLEEVKLEEATAPCPACGHQNPISALFCSECGAKTTQQDDDAPKCGVPGCLQSQCVICRKYKKAEKSVRKPMCCEVIGCL